MRGPAHVVVPWTSDRWLGAITCALASARVPYETVQLPGDDPGAYARLLGFCWALPGDLVVCEHDNVPTAAQVVELADCGHDWCGFAYDKDGRKVVRALGFTRFSAGLRARHPGLGRDVTLIQDDRPRWCPWESLDSRLALALIGHQETWTEHPGQVAHRGLAIPSPAS